MTDASTTTPPVDPPRRGRPKAERTRAPLAALEPLAVGIDEAAAMLGIGRTLLHELDAAGKLPAPLKLGGRIVWRVAELRAWMAAGAPDRERWESIRKLSDR